MTDRDTTRFERALLAAFPDLTFHLVDWYEGTIQDVPSLLKGPDGARNYGWVHGWRAPPGAPPLRSLPPQSPTVESYALLPPAQFMYFVARGRPGTYQLRQGSTVEAFGDHLLNSTYDQSLPEARSFVDKVYRIANKLFGRYLPVVDPDDGSFKYLTGRALVGDDVLYQCQQASNRYVETCFGTPEHNYCIAVPAEWKAPAWLVDGDPTLRTARRESSGGSSPRRRPATSSNPPAAARRQGPPPSAAAGCAL